MIRRLAPRRLGTDEEATVVEHLTELRHRLLIVARSRSCRPSWSASYFHTELIELAEAAAAAGQDARHARRRRAVHDRGQGERPRRDRDRAADPRLAGLGLPRSRGRPGDPAGAPGLHRRRDGALRSRASSSRYFIVLPAAITFLVELRRHALQRPDPRELLPLVHLARAARVRHRVRDADLHPRARPHPGPELRQAAPQPPDRVRR